MSSRRWASMTTYAVPAAVRDGSIIEMVPNCGAPGRAAVTFVHDLPPSRVTCTSPSSEPAQMTSRCAGDSAMAKTVANVSTPVLSPVIGPPDHCCFETSLRVRSPLMTDHDCPPSRVRNTTCAPWYTVFASWGDT